MTEAAIARGVVTNGLRQRTTAHLNLTRTMEGDPLFKRNPTGRRRKPSAREVMARKVDRWIEQNC